MPRILDKRVAALKRQGFDESRAFAIATSALQKEGKMEKGSQKLVRGGRGKSVPKKRTGKKNRRA